MVKNMLYSVHSTGLKCHLTCVSLFYLYIYFYAHTPIYICMHTCIYRCVCIKIYIHIYVCISGNALNLYVRILLCVYIYTLLYLDIHV